MPNQRASGMRHTSVTLPDELVATLDEIAACQERSRNKVIERILRQAVADRADEIIDTVVAPSPPKKSQKGAA